MGESTSAQEMLVKLSTDGIPKLFCPICNKAHVSLAGYVKHLKKHDPPGGFCCRYCEARFCLEDDLKKHRETDHTTIACRLCQDTTFANEDEYRAHIRDIHQGIDRELFKCEKCGAAYKTVDPYRRHLNTECGTIKEYKCDQCPMAFMTKYNLKQHMENHSGEAKFCCSYCGRNFRQKARLVEHERTHTGEKPYKCDVCGKSFSHRESIVTHSSIHTGIRLVECRCCSSRFSCHSNLIKHRRNRPTTCGLPEYDPPKNRVRKHTSRIPAILNPTSEIKVVNVNKVIKPDDLEKVNTLKNTSADKPKTSARKRANSNELPVPKKRGPKRKASEKIVIEFEDSDCDLSFALSNDDYADDDQQQQQEEELLENSMDLIEELDEYDMPIKPQESKESSKHAMESISITVTSGSPWSNDSDNENDPIYDESEDEIIEYNLSMVDCNEIKQEEYESFDVTTNIQIEPLNIIEMPCILEDNDNDSVNVNVKSEDEDIFNDKDKILECLLEDNDYYISGNESITSAVNRKENIETDVEEINYTLQETEMVMIQEEIPKKSKECFVLMEDIVQRFPQLKTQKTINIPRNIQKLFPNNKATRKNIRKTNSQKSKSKEDNPSAAKKSRRITASELKKHMQLLNKHEKVYNCIECIKVYYMRKPYEKHLKEQHQKSESELREIFHEEDMRLKMENVFNCHICGKNYLMEKRLLDHIPKHGPEGNLVYKCPCYCSLYFATREEAQTHAQEVHRDQIWCDICQKFLTGFDALKSHRMRLHGNKEDLKIKRNLVCDKCGKKFTGRTQLSDHVRSDCGRLPIYQCQECGKCLTTAGILKTHMLLHKDDRPFQCDQCSKSFKVKAQYKTHIKFAHSNEKRFKCDLCPKAYPYRESLLTHMSVHTGIKRFLCSGCGKRFTCVSNLQAHRKVHADTCGLLPLNAKATQYMGVQKGTLLMGAKPEPGLDYVASQTVVAKEVYTQGSPILNEIGTRVVQPSDSLSGGVPLSFTKNDIALF